MSALHQTRHDPVLLLAQRAALADLHDVADPIAIRRIMGLELMRLSNGSTIEAVAAHHLDRDHDRLAHLVAAYRADQGPATAALIGHLRLQWNELPLPQNGVHARNLASHLADAGVVSQLASCILKPQIEQLFA